MASIDIPAASPRGRVGKGISTKRNGQKEEETKKQPMVPADAKAARGMAAGATAEASISMGAMPIPALCVAGRGRERV